jgi:hypothetical protein
MRYGLWIWTILRASTINRLYLGVIECFNLMEGIIFFFFCKLNLIYFCLFTHDITSMHGNLESD